MKRNKLKVLSSLAILGIAGLGLASCNGGNTPAASTTTGSQAASSTPAPTPTPTPTTPSQTTTTTPNQSSTTNPDQKVVKSISISGGKTQYLVGEEFSFDGVTVTKTYEDDSQETATADEVTYKIYSDEDGTQEVTSIATAGTYYVYVTCAGKDNYYAITVQEKQQTIHELVDSATLEKNSSVTSKVDIYNKNGNSAYVTAASDKVIKIDDSSQTIDGHNFTRRLNMQGGGPTASSPLELDENGIVKNPRVVSITVAHDSKITVYGMSSSKPSAEKPIAIRSIILTNNGDYTKELVSNDANTIGKLEYEVKAGTYYLYSGKNAELGTESGGWYIYGIDIAYDVPASSVTYSEIELDTSNALTDFNKGTEFKTTGLVVKGLNNYGVWDILDPADYTVTNEDGTAVDTTTVGKKTLKVTAKGQTATYDIQVINPDATVESIAVKDAASKLVYKKGEELSLSGLTITATDSDSLTTDVAYDAEKISYKVLSGDTDVTENFTTLTKGTYKVELTYESQTTTYDITVLEAKEGKFEVDDEIAVGTTSYSSKLVIGYTDGTNADWSKYNDTVLSTAEGYTTKFYSDEAYTQEIESATKAFEKAGTVYLKLSYKNYSDEFTITVKDINSDSYYVKDANLTQNTDYKGQTLHEGDLVDVKVGAGTCKADSNTAINQGEMQIKLDAGDGKEIIFVVKQKITLKIIANASGNKKYIIKDASGTELKAGDLSMTADGDTIIEITLEAGTYSFTSNGGGVRFAGIEATKAE